MAGIDNLKPFKKGHDPRRGSKPKGAKHLSTWIQEMMNDETFALLVPDAKDGWKEYKGAPIKAIIQVAILKAVGGDKDAREWLARHGYGTNINIKRDDPIEALLEEFGVRKAIDDDRKTLEAVPDTRQDPA